MSSLTGDLFRLKRLPPVFHTSNLNLNRQAEKANSFIEIIRDLMSLADRAVKYGGFRNALEIIRKEGGSPESEIQNHFYSPLFELIGFKVLKAENGLCELSFQLTKEGSRIGGMIHGGITMYALDNATSMSVITMNSGVGQATLELKVNFIAPLTKDPFKAVGQVIKVGRSTAVAEGKVIDADGKVCAAALGTWFIMQ